MAHRILVVEDEPDVRDFLVDLLTAFGHQPESAGDGHEALALLAERSYELILTDLRMPEMDGEVLYQRIAETWPWLASRVIFVTAQVPSPSFVMIFGDATVPILRKPFKPDELRRLIERMLTEGP